MIKVGLMTARAAIRDFRDVYTLLQERAENIADESLRRSFLENVAVNREIVNEYEKI